MVFDIGDMNLVIVGVWSLCLLIDTTLNLNTVRVSKGKFLRNRWAIAREYLRYDSYLDIAMAIYVATDRLPMSHEMDIITHIAVMAAVIVKLSQKANILKMSFAFKKYVGLIDSVLLLVITSHLNVLSAKIFRHSSFSSPLSLFQKNAGCSTSAFRILGGLPSIFTRSIGPSPLS